MIRIAQGNHAGKHFLQKPFPCIYRTCCNISFISSGREISPVSLKACSDKSIRSDKIPLSKYDTTERTFENGCDFRFLAVDKFSIGNAARVEIMSLSQIPIIIGLLPRLFALQSL